MRLGYGIEDVAQIQSAKPFDAVLLFEYFFAGFSLTLGEAANFLTSVPEGQKA
ncbi:hypothetical protein G5B38_09940 [Pseudohalocynthiibacter aestuariivivens]|nr:hypothetical protein [Pseudohalocynthiibacter aestuariivivens]QIE45820.1 hypothetical protein G5B38_09940 [Pseudohalocynthiibacter aestuariivivens]